KLTRLEGDVRSRIAELVTIAFRPFVKPAGIDHDLAFWINFYVSAIHRTRRRTFEIDSFNIVAATMTRTFEFVLARLPIGRATQVRAARVNHKQPVSSLLDPNAIRHFVFLINAETVVSQEPNAEDA